MKSQNDKFLIYSFYRFINLKNIKSIKDKLDFFLKELNIKGTILLSNEGVNGSISGRESELENIIKYLKKLINIRKIELKVNSVKFLPFKRLKVKIKKEIVSLGKGKIDVYKHRGKLINPDEWDNIVRDKNIRLIDVRNEYEIKIGSFKRSENPHTKNFREFPAAVKKLKINKKNKIAIYCTGGIRCEKASAYLKLNGYKNIVQLKGGIIKYLEYSNYEKKKSLWSGECFVFDDRVAINKKLIKGGYTQCYGCRRPLKNYETRSIYYEKGVSCQYCFHERSQDQKKRSFTRQKQIDFAENNNIDNPFKKIFK